MIRVVLFLAAIFAGLDLILERPGEVIPVELGGVYSGATTTTGFTSSTTIATFRLENGEWIVMSKKDTGNSTIKEKTLEIEEPKNDYSEKLRREMESYGKFD